MLRGDGRRLRDLKQASQLEEGSTEQRAALRAIWMGLTSAQREEMVATSESDDGSDGGESGIDTPPRAKSSQERARPTATKTLPSAALRNGADGTAAGGKGSKRRRGSS